MTFDQFRSLVERDPTGFVLLEGKRKIPGCDFMAALELAQRLAEAFPMLRFRSGNATGSDEAFSAGVARVDPGRLHIVAPYASHRKGNRYRQAQYDSPEQLTVAEEAAVAYKTGQASPRAKPMIDRRDTHAQLGAKAKYLIRDTLKVVGLSEDYPKPICGIFYVEAGNPMSGGTGHTVRVCQAEGVPVVFQESWSRWFV